MRVTGVCKENEKCAIPGIQSRNKLVQRTQHKNGIGLPRRVQNSPEVLNPVTPLNKENAIAHTLRISCRNYPGNHFRESVVYSFVIFGGGFDQ